MRIFLIRHGESIQNTHENFEKLPDSKVYLTKKGKLQAENCGKFLKEYAQKNNINLKNATMFVSPFERTRQTAENINKILNIKDVKEDVILIERQYGLYDNLAYEERETEFKDEYNYNKWMYDNGANFYSKFPLGESQFDVYLRAKMFLDTIFRDAEKGVENFFVVSHGCFLKALQMAYFHYSPEWFGEENYADNCDIKLIEKIDNKSFDRSYIYKSNSNKNNMEIIDNLKL